MNPRKVIRNSALAVALLLTAAAAQAGPISTGSWVCFGFGASGSPASDPGAGASGCGLDPTSGNAFTFTLGTPMLLQVTDVQNPGDTFKVYEGTSLLFTTGAFNSSGPSNSDPNTAYGGLVHSWGNTLLGAGPHSINIFADLSPFSSGKGYVGVFAIPEPETYAMMLAGLGLMGFVARRRTRKIAAGV